MLNKLFSIALALVSVGCGTVEPYRHFNPELMQYVGKVYHEVLGRPVQLKNNLDVIDFAASTDSMDDKNYLGVCRDVLYRSNGYTSKQILINASWWARMDEPTRLLVIAHELGHCQWDLPHSLQAYTLMHPKISINYWNMEYATLLVWEGLQP